MNVIFCFTEMHFSDFHEHINAKILQCTKHDVYNPEERWKSMSHFILVSLPSYSLNAHLFCRVFRNGWHHADEPRLSSADCVLSWLPLWLWPDQDNTGRESRVQGHTTSTSSLPLPPDIQQTHPICHSRSEVLSIPQQSPQIRQPRPLILNLVSTVVPAHRPHLCSNPDRTVSHI